MAMLRSLLTGAGGQNTIPGPSAVFSAQSPIWRNAPGSTLTYMGGVCNGYTFDDNYCRNVLCNWCVPAGVTSITFEIWGGGGGGGATCCCAFGFPGGSGAYAKKTVTGTLGGCQYFIFPGYATCCRPDMPTGFQGCKTYITGYGLNNFCAEGGLPGRTYCNAWTLTPSTTCGFFWDSNQSGCACYFGADFGCAGMPGYLYTDTCSSDFCYYKQVFTVPAGVVTNGLSYVPIRIQGLNGTMQTMTCKSAVGGIPGGSSTKPYGMGGASASSVSGNCYCGSAGGPGFIKVSYY